MGGNITIKVLCSVMTDTSLGDPYARYAAVARLMMDTFSLKCLDASFSNYTRDMSNASWDGPAAGGGGCWAIPLENGIWANFGDDLCNLMWYCRILSSEHVLRVTLSYYHIDLQVNLCWFGRVIAIFMFVSFLCLELDWFQSDVLCVQWLLSESFFRICPVICEKFW